MQTLIPLAAKVGARLMDRGETVAVSESSAGGLISAALLAVPGASAFYRGGGVIYTAAAYKGLLGLTRDDLRMPDGSVIRSSSEPYAGFIAGKIRVRLRADWGLCETGAAGPEGNPYGDPAGHTCLGLAGEAGLVRTATLRTGMTERAGNMVLFAEAALNHMLDGLGAADG